MLFIIITVHGLQFYVLQPSKAQMPKDLFIATAIKDERPTPVRLASEALRAGRTSNVE